MRYAGCEVRRGRDVPWECLRKRERATSDSCRACRAVTDSSTCTQDKPLVVMGTGGVTYSGNQLQCIYDNQQDNVGQVCCHGSQKRDERGENRQKA